MSLVTLENARLRMERDFFARACAEVDRFGLYLRGLEAGAGLAPPAPAVSLPAVARLYRELPLRPRRLAGALARDRRMLLRRLADYEAASRAAAPWIAAVRARLGEPPAAPQLEQAGA